MNKIALVLVSAALSTALLFQFSAAQGTDTTKADTTKADTTKAKKHSTSTKSQTISGTLQSVDAIGNTIVIKTKTKEDTLTVDSATVIKTSGKAVSLGDLASGIKVTATYKEENGTKIAKKITAKPEKAPAAQDSTKQ